MDFIRAIAIILAFEGGDNHHAEDLGGRTKYGLSQRQYPELDFDTLTRDQAIEIYKRDYWDRFKIESYPVEIRFVMFDMYINGGAGVVLQRAINGKARKQVLDVDGRIGPKTRSALHRYGMEEKRLLAYRAKYYNDIIRRRPEQEKFYYGWMNRIFKILQKDKL